MDTLAVVLLAFIFAFGLTFALLSAYKLGNDRGRRHVNHDVIKAQAELTTIVADVAERSSEKALDTSISLLAGNRSLLDAFGHALAVIEDLADEDDMDTQALLHSGRQMIAKMNAAYIPLDQAISEAKKRPPPSLA